MADAANEAQRLYWNEQAGPVWAENQARLDAQLVSLGRAAQAALDPRPGERVLDIGCGAGATSLQLALATAPGGEVLGVDVSRPLLETARARAAGVAGVEFLEADAQSHDLGAAAFDAAYSRFGVMFFADTAAAFGNLRRAVRPGGRLAFVCWRRLAENPWMGGPVQAAAAVLPPRPPADPLAPGPFAFAEAARVQGLLQAAGWTEVGIAPHDEPIGVGDAEETLALALQIGPLGAALREAPHLAEAAAAAVRAYLEAVEGPQGVRLPSATWIVTAVNP